MKHVFTLLGVLGVLFFSANAQAIESKKDQRTAFEAVLAELKVHYGMIKYKEKTFGVSYDEIEHKYLRLIDNAMTLEEDAGLRPKTERQLLSPEEFRQLMIGVAAEFRDGHTNILRQTKNAWTLGIRTAAIGGRLYVVGFNKDFYDPNSTFPALEVGDEIVEVDGHSVESIARENMLYMSLATHATRHDRALEMILNVPHRFLRAKQTGAKVTVMFARHGAASAHIFTGDFHWINTHDLEELKTMSLYVHDPKSEKDKAIEAHKAKEKPYVYGESSTVKTFFSEGLAKLSPPRGSVTEISKLLNLQIEEAKKRKAEGLPHDAVLAELEPTERLPVYTIAFEGQMLGVLRMPNYSPGDFKVAVNEIKWLQTIVGMLEHTTSALIVDQLSNGGGYVWEFNNFVRLFAAKEDLTTATLDMKLSETLFIAHDPLADPDKPADPDQDPEKPVEGHRKNFGRMMLEKAAFEQLRARFAQGERWSGPLAMMNSFNQGLPGEMGRVVGLKDKVYSKPVLILNDRRSGSGGDFMPAAMQAAKRALVFGETSMGLGGPVYRSQASMPGSELFMRCTMGFCLRGDGLPIENIGVVPDLPREVTPRDLKNGFAEYAHDALTMAGLLAKGAKPEQLAEALKTRVFARDTAPPSEHALRVIQAVASLRADLKGLTGLEALTARYEQFFGTLKEIELSKLTHDEWRRIEIPLPEALLETDPILASLTGRDEVIERLGELEHVISRGGNAAGAAFLAKLRTHLATLGAVYFNPCMAILTGKALPGA
jgi:hypothetical protein